MVIKTDIGFTVWVPSDDKRRHASAIDLEGDRHWFTYIVYGEWGHYAWGIIPPRTEQYARELYRIGMIYNPKKRYGN